MTDPLEGPPPAAPVGAQPIASTSGRSAHAKYDYGLALDRLQERVQQLTDYKNQFSQPPSSLRSVLSFLRSNSSNIISLLCIYSIATATVIGAAFMERQKQVRGGVNGSYGVRPVAAGKARARCVHGWLE